MSLAGSFALKSDYVGSSGAVIGSGPVQQNYLQLELAKRLALSFFTNYDFGDAELNEYDIWLTFRSSLLSIPHGLFKGSISGRITVEKWLYPGYEPDYVTSTGVFYSGPFDADVDYLRVITHGWKLDDEKITVQLSLPFALPERKGMQMTWTPLIKTTYNHHYFDKTGWGHITPGVGFDLSKKGWTLSVSLKNQLGMNGLRDLTYYEVSLNASDLLK